VSPEGACRLATPRALAQLGVGRGDAPLDGADGWDVWPAGAARRCGRRAPRRRPPGGRRARWRAARAGGRLEVRATPAGGDLLVTLTAADDDPLDREAVATLDRLPDVVLRYDRHGVVRYVNAAIEHATGRPPAHFLGRPASGAEVDPEISARFAAARARGVRDGRGGDVHDRAPAPRGRPPRRVPHAP
jgi:hypothetical protein